MFSDRFSGINIGHPIVNGLVKPELSDAIDRILAAAHEAGKKCGIYCTSGAQASHFAAKGFNMCSTATDVSALQLVLMENMHRARGKL